ncbi:MAG TPA: exodeoxyribonuclease VII large subunit [Epsilonproteobacteria bacterium]|nr:exodeoxyribonuclease VII large subunit [Campylobacterota bacterium]
MKESIMTVSSLNTKIKSLLEATFMHISVEGEIASETYHQASGHVYFSIKDEKSSIKCVMFRSNAQKLKFRLEKGEHITVEGSVGVYTPRGEYQFYAVHIEPFGRGALVLAYEQLKAKLKQKGYFDKERKKVIPKSIRKIVLVTAKESAALHDMLKIIEKRWPLVSVTIVDTLVQGERAAEEIARALAYADTLGADVIVTGRGGGSAEDLWAFNEECVADALYRLKSPVVSAVGHEVDIVISDFVADLRAPTPSAAIEMVLPDKQELLYTLDEHIDRFGERVGQILFHKAHAVKQKEDELRRFSIEIQLSQLLDNFSALAQRYKSVMGYKLEQFRVLSQPLVNGFLQQIDFVLEQKSRQKGALEQQYLSNNPRKRAKEGWAKVSVGGKSVSLDLLEPKTVFVVEDANTTIEAVCRKKSKF